MPTNTAAILNLPKATASRLSQCRIVTSHSQYCKTHYESNHTNCPIFIPHFALCIPAFLLPPLAAAPLSCDACDLEKLSSQTLFLV